MPSGIAFSVNDEDLIYVFDSESDNVDNPGFEQGIRIGDALNGWVKHFILDQGGNPSSRTGSGPEFGTVDKFGNVFAGRAPAARSAKIRQGQVVWRFRSPHHFCGKSEMRTSEPKPH